MRVFIGVNWLATILKASAFTLIVPDVGYTGVHAHAEICEPKLCVRKTCSCCVSLYCCTFKLGLPSNNYANLVHIDGMQATFNMAKRPMAVSKGTSPGTSAISNIPFMVPLNQDGLASGMYQNVCT